MYKDFNEYADEFESIVKEYGGEYQSKLHYVMRRNVGDEKHPFPDEGAYFGCIAEGQPYSGVYADFSIVIFPSNEENEENDRWLIGLVVGSEGLSQDY